MRLDLSSLDLIVSGPTGPGVAAALKVQTDDGGTTTVPDFVMGFGMPVPANVKGTFTALSKTDDADTFTIEDGGTWLHTDPTRTDQRWFVQWRNETALICGETSAGGVDADGLTLRNALLRVVLRSGATDANIVRIWIEGDAVFSSNVGSLQLHNVGGRFTLEVNAEDLPDLQRMLENPASVLDGAFTGRLTVSLTAAQIALLTSVVFRDAEVNLTAQVSSAAGARRLRLDASTLKLGGRLLFAGAELAQSQLEAHIGAWPAAATTVIELDGQGTFTLPASVSASIGGAGVATTLRLRCSATTTRFEFTASGVRLNPAVNVLGLTGVGFRTVFSHDVAADRWSLAVEGTIEQSWSNIANKIRAFGLVDLGGSDTFPDVRATLSVAAQSLPTTAGQRAAFRIALGLELVQHGHPYEGPIGNLPVRVSAPRFRIAADVTASGFSPPTIEVEGRLSVTGELASILPWQNLRLGAQLTPGQAPQLLRLYVTGMPPFVLPPLQRGGQPIPLLRIESAEFQLGATVSFGGTVSILPELTPQQLVARLGLPAELAGFLRPVSEWLVGLQGHWNLTYNATDGSGSMAISFEKPGAPELDVFEILRSLFPAQQGSGSGFRLANDYALLRIQPGSVGFIISFGGTEEALVQLDANVFCTILNERFNARFALRMRGASPELELVAGDEDPISISFPGIEALGSNAAQILLSQLENSYSLTNRDRQYLRDAIWKIAAFFTQPGMDTAAQFELRQLRLIIRPTDAAAPVEVSGVMRPVRLPNFVSKVLPVAPSVALGATARSVFFELHLDDDTQRPTTPLVSVPLGANRQVDFILRGFKVAYSWDSNSVDLGLEVNINTANLQFFDPAIGTGVLLPQGIAAAPSIASAFAIRTIASAPPIPVPEWNVTFGDVGNPNNRGIEFIIGIPNQRFLTLNLRKTAFSITRTLFGPGGDFDGGFIFGNPPANENDTSQFYLRGSCIEGVFITYPSALVPLLNPLGTVFMPPIPLGPSHHGDIFFRELNLVLNIPGLLYGRLKLEKPLPEISLLTIIELIYLASKGFAVPLPATSSLRKVFFVALRGSLKLPLPQELFGTASGRRIKMVEVVDLDAEFNAADVLSTIGQALSAGQQIMEAAGQGLDLLVNNPSMLIRMIPRDKRSFAFDESLNLPGLKLWLRVSAFLLTPEELKEELVLYHESRRPFGKGTGRVRLGPTPPPTSPVVNRTPTLTAQQNVTWTHLVNTRDAFNTKGTSFQEYLSRKRAAAERDVRERADREIRLKLRPTIRDSLREMFFQGSTPIWNMLKTNTPERRRSELERRGLGFAFDLVEQAIRNLLAAPSPARAQEITERLVDQIADAAPLSTPEPLDLGENRRTLAANLASQLMVSTPSRSTRGTKAEIVAAAARNQLFRGRFTKPEHRSLLRTLDEIGNAAEEKMRTKPPANQAEERAFRAEVERDILRALNERAVLHRPIDLVNLSDDAFGTKRVENSILNAFKDRRQTQSRSKAVTMLDLNKTLRLTMSAGKTAVQPVPARDRVREVVGHQVKPRPDGPHAGVAFAVDVPGQHVTFRVEYRRGRFVLVVSDSRRAEISATDVPARIVGSRTPAPGVAAELTRMFVIAPKVVERAMKNEEKAARDDDPQESSPSLYQNSLFARDEYAIRDSGGRRGKLTLADLLRAPTGSYVIPGGPVLIAAGRIDVFNHGSLRVELGVVGLLAPPVGGGPSGIFLYGHQTIVLPLPFGYELSLEGDFHVVAGDMWPATLADPSIERNSVSFAGVARLRRNGRDIVNGAASGHFRYPSPNGATEFSLRMGLKVGDSWELEFGDVSFIKASFEAESDLEIEFEDGSLSMRFATQADLKWQLAEFATRTERLPSFRVCSPNPLGWLPDQPDTICVTVGGGTIEVPDPTRLVWGSENSLSASISASLQNGAIRIVVSVPRDSKFNYQFDL